jgi:hypothetical protein
MSETLPELQAAAQKAYNDLLKLEFTAQIEALFAGCKTPQQAAILNYRIFKGLQKCVKGMPLSPELEKYFSQAGPYK